MTIESKKSAPSQDNINYSLKIAFAGAITSLYKGEFLKSPKENPIPEYQQELYDTQSIIIDTVFSILTRRSQ